MTPQPESISRYTGEPLKKQTLGPTPDPRESGFLEADPGNNEVRSEHKFLMQTPARIFLQMQVWDTAGQERFRTITQSYYRSAHAAIIAYDSPAVHVESVPHWIHEIEKYGAANLVIMLIGMWISRHFSFLTLPCSAFSGFTMTVEQEVIKAHVEARTSKNIWARNSDQVRLSMIVGVA